VQHTHQVQLFNNESKKSENVTSSNMGINRFYNVYQVSITIDILGSQIEVGIDTQSPINFVIKETFEKMIIKPDLLKNDSIVCSFDGKQPLKSIGFVKANNKSCDCEFIFFKVLVTIYLAIKLQ
jgi:hypothetical protein